jgi:hypothetical protein
MATRQGAASARGQAWKVVGGLVSWLVLLGIPLVSMAVAVAALSGRLVLDPMWIASFLILAVVFLHAAERISWDQASDGASSPTDGHRNQLR